MKKGFIFLVFVFLAACTTQEQTQETTEEILEERSEDTSQEREEDSDEGEISECTEEQMDSCDQDCGVTEEGEITDAQEACFVSCLEEYPCTDPLAEVDEEEDTACNFQESEEEISFVEEGQVLGTDEVVNLEVIPLADGSYKMFYHYLNEILSASSSDGKSFTLENEVILEGKMPATIRLEDGSYRMYYSDTDSNMRSATSTDGEIFTKESGVRIEKGSGLDAYGLLHPSIVILSDGSYKLYYDGQSSASSEPSSWHILSASSEDGVTWTKDSGQRIELDEECELEYAASPDVVYDGAKFIMYFMSEAEDKEFSGIWRAESSDGLSFEIMGDQPIIAADEKYFQERDSSIEGGPAGLPQDPFVLKGDAEERIFYWKNDEGIYSSVRET